MSLLRKIIVAGPMLHWLPVGVVTAIFALVVLRYQGPDPFERALYLRCGLLVVALGVTFTFDDSAAATTDAVPSPLMVRRLLRALVAAVPWAALVGVLILAGLQDPEPPQWEPDLVYPPLPVGRFLLEAATMAAIGLALAAFLARKWSEQPGKFASASMLALFALSWAIPAPRKPWVNPYDEVWTTVQPWWWAVFALGGAATVWWSRDTRTTSLRRFVSHRKRPQSAETGRVSKPATRP